MYALVNEDLSHLGGPMGTEYTTMGAPRYFHTLVEAKAAAQKHYHDWMECSTKVLTWVHEHNYDEKPTEGRLRTADLGWVMYHIEPVKAES
jgi:hypothetical protein